MDIDLVSTEKKVDALTYQIWNFGANLLHTVEIFYSYFTAFVKNGRKLCKSKQKNIPRHLIAYH